MSMKAPLVSTIRTVMGAVGTAGNDLTSPAGQAPFAGVVSAVRYIPTAALSGANTNSRTLNLYNRGQAGSGTTVVASLALLASVDLVANDEKAITLTATAADRVVAAGDTLDWESLHILTGITDPGGVLEIDITRT
jgi:hypothetical protein